MSYILDALKKSEEQRGQGAIPNVQTVHSSSLNYRDEKKAYWPYILVAAVIVNLAAIVYFIVDKDNISSVQDTAYDNNAEKIIAANNTQTALAEIPKKQVTTTRTEIEPEKIDTHAPATVAPIEKKTNSTNSSANITAGYNSNAVVNKRPAQVQKQAQTQKEIIDFYDLPDSIQQQLPAIIVSAHVYSSNPLQRSIVINNNFMEEGEYVIDNLILYEITADGAIFDYGETRFSYNVVSGWQ